MRTKLFLLVIGLVVVLFNSCKDEVVEVEPNHTMIEYLSFKDKGCQSLLKNSGTESLKWSYRNDSLRISSEFRTHCSAIIKDSVVLSENKIEIYLRDINANRARCTCMYKESFVFYAESPKTIKVRVYYKPNNSEEYTLIDYTENIKI